MAATTAAIVNDEEFNKTASEEEDVADKSLVYDEYEDEEKKPAEKTPKGRLNNGTSKKKTTSVKSEPEDDADEGEENAEDEDEEDEEDEEEPEKKVVVKKTRKRRSSIKGDDDAEQDDVDKKDIVTTSLKIEPVASTSNSKPEEKKEANEVDLDQCRVCKTKDDLVDLFSLEDSVPISDLIMTVTSVKILERDYLPKLVCKPCITNLKVAVEFKTTCEATDAEFRSKLKRSKKTGRVGRRKGDFILVDCEISSGGSDNEAKDDDEFQLSEAQSDSDVSFNAMGKRKKRGRPRKSSPKKRLSKVSPKTPASSKRSRRYANRSGGGDDDENDFEQAYVDEAPAMSSDSSDDEPISKRTKTPVKTPGRRGRPPKNPEAKAAAAAAAAQSSSKIPHKKRAIKPESDEEYEEDQRSSSVTKHRKEHPCPFCDEVFPTIEKLKEHKKKYIGLKPLTCKICQKAFKQRVSYETHVKRHQEDETRLCKICSQPFGSRMELRRHEQSVHDLTFECDKCKRPFTSKLRLEKHIENKCPGFENNSPTVKRKSEADGSAPMGKDLFKCVAPLTTTYWSDSFSD